VHVI